jgi:hypothetical protein
MLQLASSHGHLLRSSWKYVLECISRIDHYLHYAPPGSREADIFNPELNKTQRNEALDHIELLNSETIKMTVDPNLIHFIFSKSSNFDLEEIIEFITCLCKISE